MNLKNFKYNIYLIVATILWGANFHYAKFMVEESSFIEAGTWRYLFGVIPLVLLSLKSFREIRLKSLPMKGIFLIGFFGLFCFCILFFLGMQYSSAMNGSLIVSLNPLMTVACSAIILNTKFTKYHLIGGLISLFGVVYLIAKGSFAALNIDTLNIGDLMFLVSTSLFALHNVWVKQYRGQIPNMYFTAITNLICLLGLLVIVPFTDGLSLNHTGNYWFYCFAIGTLGTSVAYYLWNEGVHNIGADVAGMFMNIVPLSTAIMSIFLGEKLLMYHIVSGVLIVVGILISKKKIPTQ